MLYLGLRNKDRGHKFVIGSGDGTLEVLCRKDPMPQGNETLMFEAQDADSCFEAIMKKAGPLVQVFAGALWLQGRNAGVYPA